MSKKLEALKKQKEAIELLMAQEEVMAKNRNRIERVTMKTLSKYPALFTSDLVTFEKELDAALEVISMAFVKAAKEHQGE